MIFKKKHNDELPKHEHKFHVSSAKQTYIAHVEEILTHAPIAMNTREVTKEPVTHALLLCECGEIKSMTIEGHFQIRELRGEIHLSHFERLDDDIEKLFGTYGKKNTQRK